MSELKITLEAARVNAGYNQKTAAKLLHVDPYTLRNWEKGNTSPTWKKVEEIEKLYKISKDNIFFNYNYAKNEKERRENEQHTN